MKKRIDKKQILVFLLFLTASFLSLCIILSNRLILYKTFLTEKKLKIDNYVFNVPQDWIAIESGRGIKVFSLATGERILFLKFSKVSFERHKELYSETIKSKKNAYLIDIKIENYKILEKAYISPERFQAVTWYIAFPDKTLEVVYWGRIEEKYENLRKLLMCIVKTPDDLPAITN